MRVIIDAQLLANMERYIRIQRWAGFILMVAFSLQFGSLSSRGDIDSPDHHVAGLVGLAGSIVMLLGVFANMFSMRLTRHDPQLRGFLRGPTMKAQALKAMGATAIWAALLIACLFIIIVFDLTIDHKAAVTAAVLALVWIVGISYWFYYKVPDHLKAQLQS